jgi:hypothetical protein
MEGQLPPDTVLTPLLPETKAIIHTLALLPQRIHPEAGVTEHSFHSLYKSLNKKTSSSPSGRHLGHYKAILQDENLVATLTKMMTIPHLTGYSPRRWQQVVDVMLQKTPGNSKIHRLRIVALQESDFNQSNRLAVGRPVLHHLEDTASVPTMQYGQEDGSR